MSRLLSRERMRDAMLGLALLCATLALMLYPQPAMEAARSGLRLCYNVIIPSLFPFFVLSSLVVELGLAGYLGRLLEGLMRPLFRVGGACASAVALGFIGGYPVGVVLSSALGALLNWLQVRRAAGLRLKPFEWVVAPGLAALLMGLTCNLLFHIMLDMGVGEVAAMGGCAAFGIVLYLAALQAQGMGSNRLFRPGRDQRK